MSNTALITCPQCGNQFNVEDVLTHEIEEKYKVALKKRIDQIKNDYEQKENELQKKETDLQQKIKNVNDEVEAKLYEAAAKKEIEIKQKIENEFGQRIKMMTDEQEETNKKLQQLNQAKVENEQLKRKIENQEKEIELKYEQRMSEQLKSEADKIRKNESERVEMKLKERDETIHALSVQMDEMKRRAEQGSMQLQGEVQELILEETLKNLFPFDIIDEVAKGVKGADVIQTVRNKFGNECGKIIYESKRTKVFSNEWINKLKHDAVAVKANICVIVTETMPDGMDRIGQKDNVWICSFNDLKGLVLVLRESLIKIHEAYESQINKGDKMQMLYDYLTSNEFNLQMGAIIEGFTDLHANYIQEKRAMERIWKQREKQLEKVLLNTNHFIGSLKGIAGNSIPGLKLLGKEDNILDLEE